MNEQEKYNIIKTLCDKGGNKKAAALKIGCSLRHINRMICGYRQYGKEFFSHKNIQISEGTVRNILLENHILSPKAWRRTRKALAKQLREKAEASRSH